MFSGIFIIFCFLMIGFAMKIAKKDYSDVLIHYSVIIAFPALIIEKLYSLKIETKDFFIVPIAMFSIVIGLLIGFLLSKVMRLSRQNSAIFILACALGNTSFIGLPYIEALFGTHAMGYALFFDQFGTFVFLMTVGSIIAAWGAGKTSSIKKLAKGIVVFPPFMAVVAALLLRFIPLPELVLTGLGKLAATLVPIVTIAVGMKMDMRTIGANFKATSVILAVKMVIVPLVVLVVIKLFVTDMSPAFAVAFIESSMPPMTMIAVFAMRYGLDTDLAISAIALGVVASLAVVPALYFLL